MPTILSVLGGLLLLSAGLVIHGLVPFALTITTSLREWSNYTIYSVGPVKSLFQEIRMPPWIWDLKRAA
jgi:uncharacterized membrane protein YesL